MIANANKINETVFLTKSDPAALNAMPVTQLSHSMTIEKIYHQAITVTNYFILVDRDQC